MGTAKEMGRAKALTERTRGAAQRALDAAQLLRTGSVPARRQAGQAIRADRPPRYYGWTRYSAYFIDHGGLGFQASRRFPTEQDYLSYLWSDERMSVRDHIFLELSVPILQSLRDRHDYRHVVTYSPEMPDPWLSRLHDAAVRYDVLDLRAVSHGGIVEIMRSDLESSREGSGPVVWFRVDDDDLLSTEYLDLLDNHVQSHGPMWAVSLSKGFDAVWHEGRISLLRGRHRPLGSQGQAYTGYWDAPRTELRIPRLGSHTKVDTRVPTVLDSRRSTFLQLLHVGQDTRTAEAHDPSDLRARQLKNRAVVKDPTLVFPRFPTIEAVYDDEPDPVRGGHAPASRARVARG